MEQEYSILQCRHCGETKKRFLDGKYPNRKDKRWVDADGIAFNGLVCPQCNRIKKAQHKRIKKSVNL